MSHERRRPAAGRSLHLSWLLAAVLVLAGALPALASPGAASDASAHAGGPAAHGEDFTPPGQDPDFTPPGIAKMQTLRGMAPQGFNIGSSAAGGGHHLNADYPEPFPNDEEYREVLAREFNSVTPENQLKWDHLRPDEDTFDFAAADEVVEFAEANGQQVHGHVLFWHSQNPAWLEEYDGQPEELRAILEEHVKTVVGRYEGRIAQWDVANEIFSDTWENEDGEVRLRTDANIWLRNLGVDIIGDVFRWAHEADPDALLFLNDYNVEGINEKSTAYYELVQDLLADDVPIHGFGAQAHLGLQYGIPGDIEENLQRFDDLGLATAITEADVRMVLEGDEPTEEQVEQQADWYGQLLDGCLAVEGCNTFTTWGFPDAYSWVPVTFENEGAATIYWNDYTPKPAYHELYERLADARPGGEHRPR